MKFITTLVIYSYLGKYLDRGQ